ncbi:MAG: LexA repressor [Candidatus Parcubacteria bacterium]|jgi:repressor LexA
MFQNYKDKILSFYQKNRRMPVYQEIMTLLGFKSRNAVYKLINKLVEQGIVTKDAKGKLIPNNLFGELPMLGSVTAGLPMAVEPDQYDSLSLDDFLIENKSNSFMLEVDGDSMIDAQIADGDLVIAEKTNKAKDGQIVIAEVDGEWTMKYFRQKGTKVWLQPANKKYSDIHPEHDLKISAVVKAVIRKL